MSQGLLDVIKTTPGLEPFSKVIDESISANPTR
jgi:hypothetical protein